LQQIQSELARLSRINELGEMASTLAHEINQPLAAIANYAQGCVRFLKDVDDTTAARIRDAVEEMAKQSLRAGGIIRHLREFVTRGETERSSEDVRPVFEFISDEQNVMVDKVQIQQVLINLMRNSIEAMRESDRRDLIVRTVGDGPGHVMIEVADTGPGISDEIAARLFQPFVTSKANGMGIGLSISKRIIESHGGQISVTRNTTGGATFRFSLPVAGKETTDAH
jgi:two-component system sensor kinase FixL